MGREAEGTRGEREGKLSRKKGRVKAERRKRE